jgi:hypothetical protein
MQRVSTPRFARSYPQECIQHVRVNVKLREACSLGKGVDHLADVAAFERSPAL